MASPSLYQVDLDPDSALDAVKSGGTILLVDVPPGTCIGIDHNAFAVGEKFVGVKMVPPGVHFISSSSGDSQGGFAPVVGFFVHVRPGDIVVRRWNKEEEMLVGMEGGESEEEGYKRGVLNFDFDSGLAPYDLRGWKKWRGLSEFITEEIVERVSPVGGCMSVMGEGIKMDVNGSTVAERALLEQLGKGRVDLKDAGVEGKVSGNLGGRCFYTKIHSFARSTELTGSELTAIHLDKSPILESVLTSKFSADPDGLLGELQFAFVSFVMCQSLQGLQQWKSILGLMLGCEHACLDTHRDLFVKFSRCVRHQLAFGLGTWTSSDSEASSSNSEGFLLEGILGDSVLDESFLKGGLMDFLGCVHEACEGESDGVDVELYGECLKIGELVKLKLNWELEDGECGEYAPVVVDL
ncbi:hypothetical protein BSKO_11162 [Bryopsis sp. KO-2023]|nr:hypothetical protein BSKO_11162 [Bryopsis sp. KO-2023]